MASAEVARATEKVFILKVFSLRLFPFCLFLFYSLHSGQGRRFTQDADRLSCLTRGCFAVQIDKEDHCLLLPFTSWARGSYTIFVSAFPFRGATALQSSSHSPGW